MSLKENDIFFEHQKEIKDEIDEANAELQIEADKQKENEEENPFNKNNKNSFKQDLTPLASIVKSIFGDWNN